MAAPAPVRLAARSHARRAMCPEWSREPAQAVARKRSGPEGFLDDEDRGGEEPRRVAELKEPRAGSGERTAFQFERAEQSGRGRPPQGPCRFAGAKRKAPCSPRLRSEGACPPGVEAGAQSVRREQERERSSWREGRTEAAERTNAVNAAGLSGGRSGRRAGDRATEGSSRRSAEREGRSSIRAERAREGTERRE